MGKAPENPHSFLYFGDELIKSEDLDPIYTTLVVSGVEGSTLKKTLLAYWCYYSLGTAARIAEAPDFYDAMWQAHHEKWPHGFERRHYYGKSAHNSITHLQEFGPPEKVVDAMTEHLTFKELDKAVQSFTGFGMWMAWKVGDMAERVSRIPVDFSQATLGIYKDPVQGAALMLYGDKNHKLTEEELKECCDYMEEDLADHDAPPHYDRPVNIQEVETVLCKYKAYYYGHYYVGKDTHEINAGLLKAQELGCDLAQLYQVCLPNQYKPFIPKPYEFQGEGYHEAVCGINLNGGSPEHDKSIATSLAT